MFRRFIPNQTPCGRSRREFLWQVGGGFAGLALIDLLSRDGFGWRARGVKGGQAIGATDELGFRAVEDRCHVSDLHATILHLMGLDYTKLTFFHQGLNQRLTGTEERKIITKALA